MHKDREDNLQCHKKVQNNQIIWCFQESIIKTHIDK